MEATPSVSEKQRIVADRHDKQALPSAFCSAPFERDSKEAHRYEFSRRAELFA